MDPLFPDLPKRLELHIKFFHMHFRKDMCTSVHMCMHVLVFLLLPRILKYGLVCFLLVLFVLNCLVVILFYLRCNRRKSEVPSVLVALSFNLHTQDTFDMKISK